ncbi:EamA family transporter [Arenibacter sp. M-2]|uniref:DMT family transporter n=1 Tax=Arenibacter sp. M-2 TaxID=3053612 RepID=UPI0025706AC4|nr:DMT family transporter [Arenibacter sp. M-2]MDL5512523.1 EamA family transporter [Arenibacter sp. M-2]
MKKENWLFFVITHVIFLGIWGALVEISEKNGFPATLGYVVWACTMIPAAIVALKINNWQLEYDKKAMFLGFSIGLLGSIGQLVLFITLKIAPAYLVFPLLSLTPVVTILLAVVFLKERTGLLGWLGIGIAVLAILMLSYQPPGDKTVEGYLWLILTLIPLLAWGSQGFIMRFANESMKAESIFFYMMVSSVLLIPMAIYLTDFSEPINWNFDGPYLTAIIQFLNAFGVLFLVYAFRFGKAIIVAPMTTALSPVLTVVISLAIYNIIPHFIIIIGMVSAIAAAFLMGIEETKEENQTVN